MNEIGISIFIVTYILVGTFAFIFIDYALSDANYRTHFKIKKIRFIVFASLFAIFNFVVGFFSTKVLFLIILVVITNIVSLIYFFFDLFYIQEKNSEYTFALEQLAYKRVKIEDVFDITVDKAKYVENKKCKNQEYSVIQKGDGKYSVCYSDKDENIILTPKEESSKEIIEMYCHLLSLEDGFEEMNVPVNKNIILDFYMNYASLKPSKFYYWVKANNKKIKLITQIITLSLIFLFSISVAIFKYVFGFDLLDFLFSHKIG